MDQITGLELGVAEQVRVVLADEQAGQSQKILIHTLPKASGQLLSLGFEVRGERLLGIHSILSEAAVWGGNCSPNPIMPRCVQKFQQLSSYSHHRLVKAEMRL